MATLARAVFLFVMCQVFCEGFNFTLDTHGDDPSGDFKGRQVCGVLRCSEMLKDVSGDQGNDSRRLTSLTISKDRLNEGDTAEQQWRQLASVTPRQPVLNQVADGVRAIGQLSEQRAELSLELVKTHDCQESQFFCVAVSVDNQGRSTVTKSVVGKGVSTLADVDLLAGSSKVSVPLNGGLPDDQSEAPATLAQLMSFFQARFDTISSRMDDSLRTLENRLEDKIGDLGTTLRNVENRMEDKLTNLQIRVSEGFSQTKSATFEKENIIGPMALMLNGLENKLNEKIDTCANEIAKQNESTLDNNISDQLNTLIRSIGSMEDNVAKCEDNFVKLQALVDQRTLAASVEDAKFSQLVTSVSSLSDLTQNLVSQVSTFRKSYAGGALMPVEEFSDPLNTGRNEWRLIFRGTAYNSVEFYPAYMHGTGIPLEVEAGCKQFNRSLPCVNHYRNRDAFDNWAGIDKVLFAVYKDGQLMQKVVLSGKGSTYTSWFAADRVLFSSWDDLTKEPHNFFSMTGYVSSDPGHTRRFHINRDYDKGCNGFKGWFSVKDKVVSGCPVEATISVPMFHYASGKTFADWTGPSAARADAVGVFLKYE